MPKQLYQEKIGPQSVGIFQWGNGWTVWGEQENKPETRCEKYFAPSPYRDSEATYAAAIRCFDLSCEASARIFKTARPIPEKPNFIKAVTA